MNRQFNGIAIRPIGVSDYEDCCALWQVTEGIGDVPAPGAFAAHLRANPHLGQVALDEAGRVVGAILATSDGIRGMFYRLAVDRSYRRQGVATSLVENATRAVQATGVSRINIHVFTHNAQALAFWSELGYGVYEHLACLYRRDTEPTRRLRPALPADLYELMELVASVIAGMRATGIDQWDEQYPDRARIAQDVREGAIQVLVDAVGVAGMVVLNADQDPSYAQPIWHGAHPAVVHRLMVHPRAQGSGAAHLLMRWVHGEAQRRGFDSLRLDAFERNPAAMRLYPSLGYMRCGTCEFRKGRFALFEKALP